MPVNIGNTSLLEYLLAISWALYEVEESIVRTTTSVYTKITIKRR